MKHVLFIGWYPNPIDKYKNVFFQNLIYEMARQGVDCTVISPVSVMKYREKIVKIPYHIEEDLGEGVFVHTYYPKTFSASSKAIGKFNTEVISERLFEASASYTAKKLSNNKAFDAVYGHFFLYGGLAAIKIGRSLSIPSFVAFGECDYESQIQETYGDLQPKDINGLSGVISVSAKNAKKLEELGIFRDIPVIIAPNAVDQSLFYKMDKNKCRSTMGLPFDKFIVGFVGGFIERKGDKRLLEAANQIDDVYLAFAGVGDNPPSGERVLFCKPLEHDLVPVFLNSIDVFCLPTLSEGSCNAVAEALACGVPVVSSNLSFNDDVINDNNAVRINPKSVSEIRNAISLLKNDKNKRERIAKKGYSDSQKYSISARAKTIQDFMSNIVRKHNDENSKG